MKNSYRGTTYRQQRHMKIGYSIEVNSGGQDTLSVSTLSYRFQRRKFLDKGPGVFRKIRRCLLGSLTEDWATITLLIELHFPNILSQNSRTSSRYTLRNDVHPFNRWVRVMHSLKFDWMWVETAEYYLNLKW